MFAYQRVWMSPQHVIAKMFENLQLLDSFSVEGSITGSVDFDKIYSEETSAFEQSTAGLLPLITANQFAQNLELSFDGAVESFSNIEKMTFRTALSLPTGMAINMIFFPEQTYLQLAAYPGIDTFIPSDTLINRWILFDITELQSQLGLDEIVKEVELQQQKTLSEPLLTLEQEQTLRKKLLSEEVFVLTKLKDDEIGGQAMHHFRYDVNMQAVQKIIKDTQTVMTNEQAVVTLQDLLARMEELNILVEGELWVGKEDYQLYKITMKSEIANQQSAEGKVVGTFTLSLNISEHNKAQNIIAPSDYSTIQELLEELFSTPMFGATPTDSLFMPDSSVVEIDSDNDGLVDDLERLYGSDPNNPDTDGDGFTDYEEVLNDYNPNGEGKLW